MKFKTIYTEIQKLDAVVTGDPRKKDTLVTATGDCIISNKTEDIQIFWIAYSKLSKGTSLDFMICLDTQRMVNYYYDYDEAEWEKAVINALPKKLPLKTNKITYEFVA